MQYVINLKKCKEKHSLEVSLKVESTNSKSLDKINLTFPIRLDCFLFRRESYVTDEWLATYSHLE